MKKILTLTILLFEFLSLTAQLPGDTIRVNGFNFNSTTRDTTIDFPSNPDLTFEKVMLKYTMRCPDALINDGANTQGCGEWDFSCNTYLVDSSHIESISNTVLSHSITYFDDLIFPYKEEAVYNYLRATQSDVQIITTNNETLAEIANGNDSFNSPLNTANIAGKSHFLFTAGELIAAGLTTGNIAGLSLNVLAEAGEAKFLKMSLKHTAKTELNGQIDFDGFTNVYHKNTTLVPNQSNRFNFHTPFDWDGSSNVLVEFNFTNVDAASLSPSLVEGETTSQKMGLSSTNEQEIILTNNDYIECNDYTGITGNQNRTIEAWIKTTDGSNGEICSWGAIITGRKWVFRLADGQLRVEVHGGGTESTSTVDDGEWHHVACVLDGNSVGDVKFYIDGVLDPNSVTGNTAIDTRESSVRISRGLSNRYIDATIDDVRIWDTDLSEETINEWKRLKVGAAHPNYSNLQLHYEFNEDANEIDDSSVNSRDATVIGSRYNVSHLDGASLFKDFSLLEQRPNIVFYQGDYTVETTTIEVDKPIEKEPQHFVVSNTIISADPTTAFHDVVETSLPIQFWTTDQKIFDELTGDLISETILPADGEIAVSDLEYFNRFPFYNELVSFVTPYGFFLDLGTEGKSWFMDMSDYVSILKGNKRILMTLGGEFNEAYNMEFLFIVGTPPREVIQYEQIWQATNRLGIARIDQILDDSKLAPTNVSLASDAVDFKLKSSITGHGSEGEFGQNGGSIDHIISVDQQEIFNWDINRECSFNPIFPQGGTWIFDRQGWCPGERTFMNEQDLTPFVTAGGTLNMDYTTSNPANASGDYRYHIAHQLVGYGSANFQLDAAVVGIVAPNNTAEFTRVGTICANPTVNIKNTGANALTQLTINYWLNDSQAPQVYEWNGNLDFMEEIAVEIPSNPELWFDILADNNIFHVEIANPNQGADEYSFNNEMSSSFDFPEILPSNITVEFRTNNLPNESSFQLIDASGDVIGSNNLPTANTTYTDDLELGNECYKLIVQDTGGDGLQWWANPNQGTGFVRLRDENGITLKEFEPDFGGGFEFSFSTSFPVSTEDLDFLTSINVFPNPASHFCSIEADDLSDVNVNIVDLLGRSVTASIQSRTESLITMNLEHLTKGIYFIVINKDEIITTRKIVVE